MEIVFVILIMLLVISVIDRFYQKRWSQGLDISIHFNVDNACVGDKVILEECISNNSKIVMPYLNLKFKVKKGIRFPATGNEEKISDQVYRNDIFSLLNHQKVTRKLPVICEKRGVYIIDEMQIVSKNFMLNKLLVLKSSHNARVTVFPEKVYPERFHVPYHTIIGDDVIPKRLYEDPFEFSGIRDYQTYDTISKINWNATARAGKLQVNQHDETTDKSVYLILNINNEGMWNDNDLHELGISIVAGLSYTFIQSGYQVGMICNAKDNEQNNIPFYPLDKGIQQFYNINTGLAKIDLSQENETISNLLSSVDQSFFSQALIILISPSRQMSNFTYFSESSDFREDGMWIETYHEGNTCRAVMHDGKDMGE